MLDASGDGDTRRPEPGAAQDMHEPAFRAVILVAFAALLPFVLLAFYARPVSDDFSYANSVVRHGLWGAQEFWYFDWSGRYFSTLLTTVFMHPAVSRFVYPIGPLIVMLVLVSASYALIREAFRSWLNRRGAILLTSVWLAALVNGMPSTSQGFYWVTGAFSNLLGIVLLMLMVAILLREGRKSHGLVSPGTALACFLAACIAGSNETLTVITLPLLLLAILLQVKARMNRVRWSIVTAVFGIGTAVSLFSPGNAVRAGTVDHTPSLLRAAAHSAVSTVESLLAWIANPALLGATVVAALLFASFAPPATGARDRYGKWSLSVPVIWIGLIVIAFFPAYWATGVYPPGRAANTIYVVFLAGWFITIFIGVEHFRHGRGTPAVLRGGPGRYLPALTLLTVCASDNFRQAVTDLRGPARSYRDHLDRRVVYFRGLEGANVVVQPLPVIPWSISFDDVTEERTHWRNVNVAEYYRLRTIRRAKKGDGPLPPR